MVNVDGNDMKHSYGLTVGMHVRQREYTRGQTLRKWLLSVGWGALKPWNHDELHRLGGHEKHSYWARVTVLGVSVQIGLEHGISNWASRT